MSDALSDEDGHLELSEDAISEADFTRAFDLNPADVFDIDTWDADAANLAGLSDRLNYEIEQAQRLHIDTRDAIRNVIFARLKESPYAPSSVGLFRATTSEIESVARGALFNGSVEAVDGTNTVIDMLPLTVVQIGVVSTSYNGQRSEYGHRMFRRDLRNRGRDILDDTLQLLEARRNRTGYDRSSKRDQYNDLMRRGLMAYAERAVLARKCSADWRMGQGNPLAYELLMGSGMPALIGPGVEVMRELILDHKRFVFVPSSKADRWHETLGTALDPLEYLVIETMEPYLERVLGGHYTGKWREPYEKYLLSFMEDVKQEVVVGVYRVSAIGPPHVFYAHREHAHMAARIAMADSALHEHRAFPMLLDLAHTLCSTMFSSDALIAQTHVAFADAGAALDYATERMTR